MFTLEQLRDWDGTPQMDLPMDYVGWLYSSFIPGYHICANGPPPYGQMEPVHVGMDNVLAADEEAAEARLRSHIQDMCRVWRYEYEEDDWEIIHCVLRNGN